jgi:ABC-2 type transport system ATP-binding protein
MVKTIELDDIHKTFREHSWRTLLLRKPPPRVEALKGITLSVAQGEVFGLLGPNGAGKTTLIKILATLVLPDSGTASVCGYDLSKAPHHIRRMIGLVNTAERSFYWRITGRENLTFFAALYNLPGFRKQERVGELIDLVGLGEMADTMFMKYSDGQKQRLAIARALLADPAVLLMDEPTKSLDPLASSELIHFAVRELVGEQGKRLYCGAPTI